MNQNKTLVHEDGATASMDFMRNPYAFLSERRKRHGPLFAVSLGVHGTYVFVADPEVVQQIQGADPETFRGDGGNRILEPLLGSRSVLLLEGEEHKRARKLLRPAFGRKKVLELIPGLVSMTQERMEYWRVGEQVSLREELQHIGLNTIMEMLFGAQDSEHLEPLAQHVDAIVHSPQLNPTILSILHTQHLTSPSVNILRDAILSARRHIRQELELRRAHASPGEGVMASLMTSVDEHGLGFEDEDIVDELMTLIITGHETTVTSLMWALYWLDQCADVRENLMSCATKFSQSQDVETLLKDPYMNAFCHEVLRIHPVVPIVARQLAHPISLGGCDLEVGWTVAVAISLVHHDPVVYPNAESFRPQRFLEQRHMAHQYLPFGMGARRCLGASMATVEMKVVLATLLAHVHLNINHKGPLMPVRRLVTMAPAVELDVEVLEKYPS